MTYYTGRLIDHVHLRAKDFQKSRSFYEAIFAVLGFTVTASGDNWFQLDELYVDAADPNTPPTHIHLAFQAKDRASVDAFHAAALAGGGTDNGAPGERPYHPGYYGAFVLDPDGNNIEAVFHGPSTRSADAVHIEPVF
ncbi:VOC family protein [Devosia submarina]|uniref:VOC family protein n=1 Tax=Devosia submarina TaxID=1173082 RepID=UPI000D3812D3|nr:VOC family protein [Devosia submarina]